eukprot:Blabericola_migrator_1__105@NODE_1026_length_5664_cov_316_922458_g706_i0_p2_GENE_NODE_1026_length_5664_cov_316_922458_g706_i0NODE_1026_length_5664_cov_316_922458_g706_i0_p2_ORF_typecomplete_len554_score84_57PALP/PF00291_25/3_7e67_NODE_1026_length_5664_cov_316_922458_g706_i038145475
MSQTSLLTECVASVVSPTLIAIPAGPRYDEELSVPPVRSVEELQLAWPRPLDSITEAAGNTPIVRLRNMEAAHQLKCKLYAKLEYFSCGGSVKDRIGLAMLEQGERDGIIRKGDYVLEATSGNTGIGLAVMCAAKGYKMVVVMPDKMSAEKSSVMKALGCEVVRTRTSANWSDPDSHIAIAYKLRDEINRRATLPEHPRAVIFDQYKNQANPSVHFRTTGQELVQQFRGLDDPAFFVASTGTGGTISGTAARLKEAWPQCKIVAVDPKGSILHKEQWDATRDVRPYEVEGIGYDFHPPVLSRDLIDRWEVIDDEEAFRIAREAIAREALLCGGSSGCALAAGIRIAKQSPEGSSVVVLIPDSIRNYLSKFIADDWMILHGWKEIDTAPTIPLNDDEVLKHLSGASALSVLPRVDSKATVSDALVACSSFLHCLVVFQSLTYRLISREALKKNVILGRADKVLDELDYRMTAQLIPASDLGKKAATILGCMMEQNILDPVILAMEPDEVSESTPMQIDRLEAPEVDDLRTTLTLRSEAQLSSIKLITSDMLCRV